jgi:hypothetical protein
MSEATPPITVDEAKLERLAELDLALAEKAHALAMAATDADDFNGHVRSYQRTARSLRQTLALKAKIARDQRLDAERAAERRAKRNPDDDGFNEWSIEQRLGEVQGAVGRVIAAAARERPEVERPDWQTDLYARFDREMDDWTLKPHLFMELDVDSLVRDFCARLRLPPELAAAWRDLPPAAWAPDPVAATPRRNPVEPPIPRTDTG